MSLFGGPVRMHPETPKYWNWVVTNFYKLRNGEYFMFCTPEGRPYPSDTVYLKTLEYHYTDPATNELFHVADIKGWVRTKGMIDYETEVDNMIDTVPINPARRFL